MYEETKKHDRIGDNVAFVFLKSSVGPFKTIQHILCNVFPKGRGGQCYTTAQSHTKVLIDCNVKRRKDERGRKREGQRGRAGEREKGRGDERESERFGIAACYIVKDFSLLA